MSENTEEQDSPTIKFLKEATADFPKWQQDLVLGYYRHREARRAQRTPLVEFIEDGLGFTLTNAQLTMVHRMERELLDQGEEARRIEEQSERQDEANIQDLEWLMTEGPVNRAGEQPGRHYSRTRAQQRAIDQVEADQDAQDVVFGPANDEQVRLLVVDDYPEGEGRPGQRIHVYATIKQMAAMANGETVQLYPHLVEELPPS